MAFTGIPAAAFDFYDDLEADNSKTFWEAHKQIYQDAVRTPMTELLAELSGEFGEAKLFRPYRDVRFSRDKTPYKTHQGAYIPVASATGWYLQLGASGFLVGAGFYDAPPARLAAIRQAIAGPDGASLQRIVTGLVDSGWTLGGDTVKTTPRGYDAAHERIELLRHKTISLSKNYGFDQVIAQPALPKEVAADWRRARPLLDWLSAHTQGL